ILFPHAMAQFTMPNVDARNVASLDGEWRFCLVSKPNEADELARIFIEPGFEASAFKAISVPSNWAMHGWEDPTWVNGSKAEGFYLHTFSVSESARDHRALLHFDGVWESAEVWVNGQNLG